MLNNFGKCNLNQSNAHNRGVFIEDVKCPYSFEENFHTGISNK